jgi:hypothetical protein
MTTNLSARKSVYYARRVIAAIFTAVDFSQKNNEIVKIRSNFAFLMFIDVYQAAYHMLSSVFHLLSA